MRTYAKTRTEQNWHAKGWDAGYSAACHDANVEGSVAYGAVRRSNALGASYLPDDITTLETAAEAATRAGDVSVAISLWALALRIRQAL
jgi:hypothetical protein